MKLLTLLLGTLFHTGLTYRAAVLEHNSLTGSDPKDTIGKNLKAYRYYAAEAYAQNADIIVFPEYGLVTLDALDNVTQYAIEVDQENEVINELRSLARENVIYLVANVFEKKGTKYFNTNLVFDRTGDIILKYRKSHLYNEPLLSPGAGDQKLTFTTDFGVTFGIFTCFDIVWENPGRRVLEDGDVTDIIFPTAWSAAMPFDMPLSVQHGYAQAHGVNLLVAGYDEPEKCLGGSGIYLANGEIAKIHISGQASSKLLVHDVPKISKRVDKTKCTSNNAPAEASEEEDEDIDNFYTFDDYTNRSLYKYENLDLNQKFSSHEICDKGFCCTFTILIDRVPLLFFGNYKLIAYNNHFTLMDAKWHLRVCGLLFCKDDSLENCGSVFDSTVKFEKITIRGMLDKDGWTYFMPVTLDSHFKPVRYSTYCVPERKENSSVVEIATTRSQKDVLVFGLGGILISSSSALPAFGIVFVTVLTMGHYIL